MTDWIPSLAATQGARYLAIVEALERDIAGGTLRPGTRILPQRELAERLNLSVGTVSKAYTEAERRGLIAGQVGRGTFVCKRSTRPTAAQGGDGLINLSLNAPPETGESELITTLLGEIAAASDIKNLLSYLPHQGSSEHREAISSWFRNQKINFEPNRIFITHGAQHALAIATSLIAAPSDTILTEALTYSGMLALSSQANYRLHGLEMDALGLIPEVLDAGLRESGARIVYLMPTYQTPTGSIMPQERREEIAAVIRRHDAFLIEDDAYVFLCDPAPRPISTLLPERSFYTMSFAKCLAPGLRIGVLVPPDHFRDRCINALRSTGWMAAPIMAEVVSRAIQSGALDEQIALKRVHAARRNEIARRILGDWLPPDSNPAGFHVWMPLPRGRTLTSLIAQAYNEGIRLAAPSTVGRRDQSELGVRLCLGGAGSEEELEAALQKIASILTMAEEISLV